MNREREIEKWITWKGRRIPIYKDDLLDIGDKMGTPEDKELADKLLAEYRQAQIFSNPNDYVKKYADVSPEEYTRLKRESMPVDMDPEIKQAYETLLQEEPDITSMVIDVAKENGIAMQGLSARLKEGDSYCRKIQGRVNAGMSVAEAAKGVEDGIRYTTISDPKTLVANYKAMVDAFEKKGFTVKTVENNFTDKNIAMNNLAVYFESPRGTSVEVWFHTPQTYERLVQLHGYYEALRVRKDWTDEGSQALNRTLYAGYYPGLIMPDNIRRVKATKRWQHGKG